MNALFSALRGEDVDVDMGLADDERVGALLRYMRAEDGPRAIAKEMRRTADDRRALAVLDEPIVFKGAALAHTVYPAPHTRPRADLDVWVRDMGAAARALKTLGYVEKLNLPGLHRKAARGFEKLSGHKVDVHSRVLRSVVHLDLDHDALRERAIDIDELGCRALCPSDALVICAVHLFAKNPDRRRAISLVDAALLLRAGTEVDWRLAESIRASSLLYELLSRAKLHLHAAVELPAARPLDRSSVYLAAPASWSSLTEVLLAPDKGRAAKELVWPDADYLRAREGMGRDKSVLPLRLARLLRRR